MEASCPTSVKALDEIVLAGNHFELLDPAARQLKL
jgi:hypothetical protein